MKLCAAPGCDRPLTPEQIKELRVYCSRKCARVATGWHGKGFATASAAVWAHRREA